MDEPSSLLDELSVETLLRLEEVCCRFEQVWQEEQHPRLEVFVASAEGAARQVLLRELLRLDVHYRRRAGEEPRIQDYAARFPDASPVLSKVFAAVAEGGDAPSVLGAERTTDDAERTGPHLKPSSLDSSAAPADQEEGSGQRSGSTAGAPPAGRFRVRRFHAAGGLGEVFVAEDEELHREVALKEIKREFTGHEQSRSRFVLEAEITGKLEHPGIVPVYGLGAYPDGRPYYAMRFIRGDTLSEAIARFHGQAPVRFDALEFRKLLGRLLAVCQAVAYAHDRGVLHRDLKPGNVMLGNFGETLVVDWGLAKVVGRADAGEAGQGEEGLLRPVAGGAQATVGAVGTPAYMSPEQAAGKVEELGAATDVYSLGATLYVLLTNRAPFTGRVGEVLKQVESGEWMPPREVNGSVPAALDAICRRAMALRPGDRYGSAQALAEDVEHWLADEPVSAYAEPAGTRLRRWIRKRPRRVTAAVVLLLTAVVGLTVGAVLLARKERETRETLNMVEGQANYLVHEVSEDLLLNEPGMQQMRQNILFKVLTDYEDFLKKRPGDRHARQQMAGAMRQLGEVYLQTGAVDEARALEVRSVELYEGLLRDASADRGLRFGPARARQVLSAVQMQGGNSGEGKKEVDRSVELLERLIAEEPGNGDYLFALAGSCDLRVTADRQQGDVESGLADNERVLEILLGGMSRLESSDRQMRDRQGVYMIRTGFRYSSLTSAALGNNTNNELENLGWRQVLLFGHTCLNRGILLSTSGQNGEAARVLERSIACHQHLLERSPRAGPFRHGLALALLHLGRVKVSLGLPGKAEPALRESLRLMRQLVQDDPYVKEYGASRLLAAGCLGECLFRQGRTAAAAELLREANKEGEEVLGGPRKNRELSGRNVRLLQVLGCLEAEIGNLDRGLGACRKAHEKLEQALRETPHNRSLRSDWLSNREALARCRFRKGNLSGAGWVSEQQGILERRREIVGKAPGPPRFQGGLAGSAVVLADLLLETNQSTEALACVEEVLPAHEEVVRIERERVRAEAKEQHEAAALPVRPDQGSSLRDFLRDMPIVPAHSLQRQWAMLLARRGAALARLGRDAEAVETVRQAVRITGSIVWEDRPLPPPPASPASLWGFLPTLLWQAESCSLYQLACHLALASTLPGENGRPDLAEQAVGLLRSAVASGFDNLHRFRTDPALEPLRKRADFRKLVHDLEASSPGRMDAPGNP